jgi:hypothetical protein
MSARSRVLLLLAAVNGVTAAVTRQPLFAVASAAFVVAGLLAWTRSRGRR